MPSAQSLRGRQVGLWWVTRGRMPPTDFFGRDLEVDDEENATGDIESILSMFKAAGCTERYLALALPQPT